VFRDALGLAGRSVWGAAKTPTPILVVVIAILHLLGHQRCNDPVWLECAKWGVMVVLIGFCLFFSYREEKAADAEVRK
jgi:hypothetical protein